MKKIIAILIILAALSLSAQAAKRNTVVLPLQVVKGEGFTLPNKTDYIELKKVRIDDDASLNGFGASLAEKLKAIDDNGSLHYVLALVIKPEDDGSGQLRVDIYDYDILKGNELTRRMAYGDLEVGRTHFLLMMNPDNADFLKRHVKNAGGYTRFERVFEFVAEVLPQQHTMLHAVWDGSKMSTNTYILDGEDQLGNAEHHSTGDEEVFVGIPLMRVENDNKNNEVVDTAATSTGNADNEFMTNPTSGLRLKQLSLSEEAAGMSIVKAAVDKLKVIANAEKVHNTLLLTVNMRGGYPTGFEVNSGDVIKLSSTTQYAGVIKIGGINFVLTTTPLTAPTIDQAVEDAGPTICFSHVLKIVRQLTAARSTNVKCDWDKGTFKTSRSVIDGHYMNLEP